MNGLNIRVYLTRGVKITMTRIKRDCENASVRCQFFTQAHRVFLFRLFLFLNNAAASNSNDVVAAANDE